MSSAESEIAARLLEYLRHTPGGSDVTFAEPPARLQGGFDAAIYRLRLDRVPPELGGPLVLRVVRSGGNSERLRMEATLQNVLATAGYPVPRVVLTETDEMQIGGAFTLMQRLVGEPLLAAFAGLAPTGGFGRTLSRLTGLPAMLRKITETMVELQVRLHALPIEPIMQALRNTGLSPDSLSITGQLQTMRHVAEELRLTPLRTTLTWLAVNRPMEPRRLALCHGDFHPFNILAANGQVTGVIDWSNAVIADPAMDVASTLANVATVPIQMPAPLRPLADLMLRRWMRSYVTTYRRHVQIDDAVLRYYQVFRCAAQLFGVAVGVARGRTNAGIYHSPRGIRRLVAHIRSLAPVAVQDDECLALGEVPGSVHGTRGHSPAFD